MKNNNNKKQNGFTLVEVLLIVLFISITSLGIYMMQRKASEEVTINKEQEYILSLFEKIDKASSAMSRFENISLEALKESGYAMKSTGFNLVSVTSPSLTRLEATYNGLSNKECSMFVSSLVNFNQSHSARVNNIPISTKSDLRTITRECSADSNEVVIVRENNIFGVVLNTSLDGINNPLNKTYSNLLI